MAISKITSDAIDATGFNLDSNTLTVDASADAVPLIANRLTSTGDIQKFKRLSTPGQNYTLQEIYSRRSNGMTVTCSGKH